MAAKSITVRRDAADAIAAIAGLAADLTQTPLQNGIRLTAVVEGERLALNVYPSKGGGCKVVFDRPETPAADATAALLEGRPSEIKRKAADAALSPALTGIACWIGSDESGKGDYFGPLVTAAVAVTAEQVAVLATLGVQDSKHLTDARVSALAADIAPAFPHEVVTIMPPRYNELWESMGSVNRVLAWAHARAIEEVASRVPGATAAVADQFGDEALIRDALFKRGRELRLEQMPRAERDPAVAAASILARAEFLRRLDRLGREYGARLPKGASAAVEAAARALVSKHSPDILSRVAKRHFKTTQRVL